MHLCYHSCRQVFGFQTTPRNRIIELEQTDDWMSALLEYGSIQFNCPTDRVNASLMLPIVVESESDDNMKGTQKKRGMEKEKEKVKERERETVREGNTENSVIDMTMDISIDEEIGAVERKADSIKEEKEDMKESRERQNEKYFAVDENGSFCMNEEDNEKALCEEWKACSDLERGRLRCLLELGHLDAVVDQAMGIRLRAPQLESTLIPLGIEAAWKLMKWDDLDNFLSRIDGPCTFNSTPHTHGMSFDFSINNDDNCSRGSSSSGTSLRDHGRVGTSIYPEDGFQISVGRLMQSMVRRDADSFRTELADARSQVSFCTHYSTTRFASTYQLVRISLFSSTLLSFLMPFLLLFASMFKPNLNHKLQNLILTPSLSHLLLPF